VQAFAASPTELVQAKINWRILIPKLLFVPAMGFAIVSAHVYIEDGFWDTTWEVLSFIILLVAAFGRVWTSAFISGRKDNELVTDGPYSLSRNPLYFFSFLGYIGAGLAFEKLTVALAFTIVFLLSHWPTILAEEKKLRGVYGARYDEYARTVPRFFPRIAKPQLPETVTFSPAIFNRAVLDCALIMSVFILAHFIEYAQSAHWVPVYFHNIW
jgi:protein-S-isoprenylcysteine O-methyltransferase Ste14